MYICIYTYIPLPKDRILTFLQNITKICIVAFFIDRITQTAYNIYKIFTKYYEIFIVHVIVKILSMSHYNPSKKKYLLEIFIYIYHKYYVKYLVYILIIFRKELYIKYV